MSEKSQSPKKTTKMSKNRRKSINNDEKPSKITQKP